MVDQNKTVRNRVKAVNLVAAYGAKFPMLSSMKRHNFLIQSQKAHILQQKYYRQEIELTNPCNDILKIHRSIRYGSSTTGN